MSDTSKTPRATGDGDDRDREAVVEEIVAEETVVEEVPAEEGAAVEDGVSEADAESMIAALVEAEREAEAEEAAVAEAEEAAEREEPADDDEPDDESDGTAVPAEPTPAPAAKPASTRPAKKPAAAKPAKKSRGEKCSLAVLGSPIAHSQSPALQKAAYDVLGLDWSYEPVEVTEETLAGFIDGLGAEWRGLSLTMPLKKAVLPLLTEIDRVAEQTGAANTVLLDGEDVRGFNTDVAGIVRALAGAGVTSAHYVHILGGGATAASALVAAAELGAERVDVHVRDLTRSVWLEPLAHELGLMVRLRSLPQADRSLDVPDLVISTLPGGARPDVLYTDSTRRRAVLLDVAYEPWPSALATAWGSVGGSVVSGLSMLVHQALLQVRIFVSGDPLEPLDDEDAVLAAMLAAVGIDAAGVPLEA